MPSSLPDRHACAIRVGSHRFPFVAQFISVGLSGRTATDSASRGVRPSLASAGADFDHSFHATASDTSEQHDNG